MGSIQSVQALPLENGQRDALGGVDKHTGHWNCKVAEARREWGLWHDASKWFSEDRRYQKRIARHLAKGPQNQVPTLEIPPHPHSSQTTGTWKAIAAISIPSRNVCSFVYLLPTALGDGHSATWGGGAFLARRVAWHRIGMAPFKSKWGLYRFTTHVVWMFVLICTELCSLA